MHEPSGRNRYRRKPASKPTHLSRRQSKFIDHGLKKLGYQTYGQYLTSEHWREIKEQYRNSGLQQDCFVCHDPNVDLHHKTYKRLGEERLDDLVPLCRLHHEAAHRLLAEWLETGANPGGHNIYRAAAELKKQYRARPREERAASAAPRKLSFKLVPSRFRTAGG